MDAGSCFPCACPVGFDEPKVEIAQHDPRFSTLASHEWVIGPHGICHGVGRATVSQAPPGARALPGMVMGPCRRRIARSRSRQECGRGAARRSRRSILDTRRTSGTASLLLDRQGRSRCAVLAGAARPGALVDGHAIAHRCNLPSTISTRSLTRRTTLHAKYQGGRCPSPASSSPAHEPSTTWIGRTPLPACLGIQGVGLYRHAIWVEPWRRCPVVSERPHQVCLGSREALARAVVADAPRSCLNHVRSRPTGSSQARRRARRRRGTCHPARA